MADNNSATPSDDFDDLPDGAHLSDEELEAALADFEKEFHSDSLDSLGALDSPGSAESTELHEPEETTDTNTATGGAEAVLDFDNELQGLLGNRATMAVVITRLASAELLAAFCQITDVSATCLNHTDGAVAVLRNLDGDGPEAAAKDLTTVVSGMPVILAVNRADKLEATLYIQGKAGQTFAPPILFTSTPAFVEDLMLGITDVDAIKTQGVTAVDSASLDRQAAMSVIAQHTRFGGRGHSRIQ